MINFNIDSYFECLPENVLKIDISFKDISYIPNLTKFKKLKILYCNNNQLTFLPFLPDSIQELECSNNNLTILQNLPKNLQKLYCYNNKLVYLPTLSENLQNLYCYNNTLISLPTLPKSLCILICFNNKLTTLPILHENLNTLLYGNNLIYEIVQNNDIVIVKKNIKILNHFCHLYYCLKFKKKFRDLLWEKIRKPNIIKKYHPIYLVENLNEEADLDIFLNNW